MGRYFHKKKLLPQVYILPNLHLYYTTIFLLTLFLHYHWHIIISIKFNYLITPIQ